MAVTQSSDDNLESPVEGVKPCREDAGAGPCGLLHLSKPDVASTGQPDINKDNSGIVKRCKRRRNRSEHNASDNLSDIDDAEVIGYLNTKEEMSYKKILWEAMNGNYVNAKKQKRATETKKGVPVKKAARTIEKVELQRPSTRINYDALKILYDELEQGSEVAQIISADSCTHRNEDSPNENINPENESNESNYNDFQQEISYSNEASGCHGDDLCDEYGDKHYYDEYFDFE